MQMQIEGNTFIKRGFFSCVVPLKPLRFLLRICTCLINTVLVMGSICGMALDPSLNKFVTECFAEIGVLKECNRVKITVSCRFKC